MKKILVRAHVSPFENLSAAQMLLAGDRLGSNVGNLLFANSVIRVLMTEDTQVDILDTGRDLTAENLERINQEYDCVVLPFANAFRGSFRRQLRILTKFINRLKIPCVVVGIGVSRSVSEESNEYDEEARQFVKAVLNKSAVIGTRGELTSAYLTRLGFREGSEHRVIGCPSMYWYGPQLPAVEKKDLTADSPISLNWKIRSPRNTNRFIRRNIKLFPNFQYAPQVVDEMRLMYYGIPIQMENYDYVPAKYPIHVDHPWYRQDRARTFLNIPSWLAYLREKDLSFGSRIHGNIAAILAGTPCFVLVSDARILELVEYHHIPHIHYKDLQEEDTLLQLYEQADYSRLQEGHAERFQIYADFLQENGLSNIFREGQGGNCPYDRKVQQVSWQGALRPFCSVPFAERVQRMQEVQEAMRRMQRECDKLQHIYALQKVLQTGRNPKKLLELFLRS